MQAEPACWVCDIVSSCPWDVAGNAGSNSSSNWVGGGARVVLLCQPNAKVSISKSISHSVHLGGGLQAWQKQSCRFLYLILITAMIDSMVSTQPSHVHLEESIPEEE